MEVIDVDTLTKKKEEEIIQEKLHGKQIEAKVKAQFEKSRPFDPSRLAQSAQKTAQPSSKDFKNFCEINDLVKEREEMNKERFLGTKEGTTLRGHANDILSLPYYTNPIKRLILKRGIENNDALQEIINQQLYEKCSNILNQKLRFALHYGLEVLSTENKYSQILLRQQEYQQQEANKAPSENQPNHDGQINKIITH